MPSTNTEGNHRILEWAKTEDPEGLVYWLHSPFGHGKSAIMQTIIDSLIEEGHRDRVAGSFFFGRGKHGRDKINYLLPSIAYQMAINLPGMREIINRAMLADPSLPSKSIDVQLRFLIINPLLEWANGPHFRHTPTVFIDGLDECGTIDEQLAVLDLITTALLDHRVPLRFVVASRPETHILDHFDQARLKSVSKHYQVPNDDAEMTTYLELKFNEIFEKRARIMKAAGIRKPWPSAAQILQLVRRASGQYVFLDTVLRFVDVHRFNPADRLNTVLCRLADPSVFTEMDNIYRLVLDQCPDEYWPLVMSIIDALVFNIHGTLFDYVTMDSIAEINQYSISQLSLAVDTVVAVIKLEQYEGGVSYTFHHISFYEFLTDVDRSGDFFCPVELASKRWEACVLGAFKRSLAGDGTLVNWITLNYIIHLLGDDDHHHTWTSSAELSSLLHQGQSTAQYGSENFAQWYHLVHLLTDVFDDFTWLVDETRRVQWIVGDLDTPFTSELHRQCLALWRSILGRSFAEMDRRVVDALLDWDPNGPTPRVNTLAMKAGIDEEECLPTLKQHNFLFTLPLVDSSSLVVFQDHRYVQFDDWGNKTYLRDIRRQSYSHTVY